MYGTLAAQDYWPANQAPGPGRTNTRVDADIWKKVEDKHAEKNLMGIGHLVPEQGCYKAVYSGKSKRTKD